VIRLRHETLPAGLSALVRRRADGDLDVIVSTALSAGRQRTAVRAGLRAMQPARRGARALPVPALITLAVAGTWLRAIGRLLRLRPAVTIPVAATATAAAMVIAVAPHVHGPAVAGRNPPGAALAPQRGSATGSPAPGHGRVPPSAPIVAQPLPSAMPVAARSPAGPATSQPYPAASASPQPQSAPSPTPTPSGTGGGNEICLEVLGLWVCV
jgi:hypothetical protein